ncbi:MAG: DUF2304 domain-containing protein [Candidatus Shapirobacteria bacterium]|nr:DUF2304 domain-containing protein [Candidatus Shapirobacteria bacterium]MDD4410506.1 DUF2304 domain-containing protein [Candidatus Shapirobacteria bacterium]
MNIITLQIILFAFAIFMAYSLFLHWKKKNISNNLFFFWICIFSLFIFITFFPKILEPLLKELFLVRVMDLGMIGTFMILTYVSIENNIKIKNLEEKMEKLVRKISLKK